MAELASLKKIRSNIKGSLTRLLTYVRALDAKTDEKIDALQIRTKRAQNLFDQFVDIERQIFRLDAEEASMIPEVEENYFTIMTILSGLIRKHGVQEGFLTSMMEQTVNASQITSASPSIKLPKINIPPFSGDYVEWQSFYDLYCTTIHEKDYLTASQKFQYLKGLLRGEAASLLRHFSITEANYIEALQKLTQRYDRKRHTVNAFIKTFLEQPHINQVSAASIRKLWDTSDEVVRGLKALGSNAEHRDPWLIHILVNKLDAESKGLWAQHSAEKDFPTLKELFDFLGRRTDALESVSRSIAKKPSHPQTTKPESSRAFATVSKPSCPICKSDDHKIFECTSFKEMDVRQRWDFIRAERRCFNCFNFSHSTYNCKSRIRCRHCSKKHHTLLHSEINNTASAQVQESSSNIAESKVMQVSSGEPYSQVILPTALVKIKDGFGGFRLCRALLDSTSQESFVTEECAQVLGLSRVNGRLLMKGLGDAKLGRSRGKVELSVRPVDGEDLNVWAFIIPKISTMLPSYNFEIAHWDKLANVSLADPKFNQRGAIDILLGTEIYYQITQCNKIKLEDRLVAEKTSLGWIVAGRSLERESNNQSVCFSITMDIDDSLRKFWEIEAIPTISTLTAEERKCEELFVSTTKRASDGKFIVQLPSREIEGKLGSSYHLAMTRLAAMEKRFKRDPIFYQLYNEFMAEYESLGHMVETLTDVSCYYLPHHGVLKSASTTTKLRVVFDASAKSTTGLSLNNQLCIGPTVQSALVDIILRFRQHQFVITGDIEKMYRQIWVSDADTKHQNILWRQDPSHRPKSFRLKTLTYGTAPASFLATRCVNEAAIQARDRSPIAAARILNDMYVDDLMTGADTEAELFNLKDEVTAILNTAGFNLRKFATNNNELRKQLGINAEATKEISENPTTAKVLGVNWDPVIDHFSFQVKLEEQKQHTKRSLLSEASKIFDPIGWLSPVIVRVKILFQSLWLLNLEWDDRLPPEISSQWISMRSDLEEVNRIQIPRWLGTHGSIELHGFCDASEMAYAATIFGRVRLETGIRTYLIMSKTKVAPLKAVSLPRLELMGALLMSKLMNKVSSALNQNLDRIVLWTDSRIVLDWLAAHPRRWPTFVANRTAEILNSYSRDKWMHVPSADNPADCASRGMTAVDLSKFDLWWQGPKWLVESETEWPVQVSSYGTNEEAKQSGVVFTICVDNDILKNISSNFSSFFKMKKIMAYIIRFVKNSRLKPNERNLNPLNRDDVNSAAVYLIRYTQHQHFLDEIQCLQSEAVFPKSSQLRSLNPFVDSDGIIRIGGRIGHATISSSTKHPILLPRKSELTTAILHDIHQQFYHAGISFMLNFLRQQFWVIRAKDAIRQVVHKCVKCFKQKPPRQQQLMGDLPSARVEYVHPFHKVGLDYAGPFKVQITRKRGQIPIKTYVCIFVCLSTKAVHIECVSNLTTENFLGALSRFTDRRGVCGDIFSDNGTNFVGANRQLIELFEFLRINGNNLSSSLLEKTINWHFIPAGSPTMGGIWEAAVKSAKTHLKRVVGEAILTLEEFTTLMTGIEAILNSRPLYATTSDEIEVLTPGHFLIGRPLSSLPERSIPDNHCLSKRWDTVKRIKQHFWHRWHRDYLTTMQVRNKWKDKSTNLQANDIVLIRDELLSPTQWALGRVIQTHPGTDGYVRVASIKTSSGITRKHISKLCKLPIN